jgi:hypothetical protein
MKLKMPRIPQATATGRRKSWTLEEETPPQDCMKFKVYIAFKVELFMSTSRASLQTLPPAI